jgi:hypothetical protein
MAARVIGRCRTKSLQNAAFVREHLGLPSLSNEIAVFGFACRIGVTFDGSS